MSEHSCRCGHDQFEHKWKGGQRRGICQAILNERDWLDFDICPCREYDGSRLPAAGERPQFGVHRLRSEEAETAPAWPSLDEVKRGADAKFKREQRKVRPRA